MSDDMTSPRLALPLLAPGQANKEVTHNEALARVDLLVQPAVIAVGLATPPAAPVAGETWVVGTQPGGAWAGHAGALAGWTAGGWRFQESREGMAAWSIADRRIARVVDGRWTIGEIRATRVLVDGVAVLGARAGAIAAPAGGTTVDAAARTAIEAILTALRGHGLIAGN